MVQIKFDLRCLHVCVQSPRACPNPTRCGPLMWREQSILSRVQPNQHTKTQSNIITCAFVQCTMHSPAHREMLSRLREYISRRSRAVYLIRHKQTRIPFGSGCADRSHCWCTALAFRREIEPINCVRECACVCYGLRTAALPLFRVRLDWVNAGSAWAWCVCNRPPTGRV